MRRFTTLETLVFSYWSTLLNSKTKLILSNVKATYVVNNYKSVIKSYSCLGLIDHIHLLKAID
jgi:hypothetical protein